MMSFAAAAAAAAAADASDAEKIRCTFTNYPFPFIGVQGNYIYCGFYLKLLLLGSDKKQLSAWSKSLMVQKNCELNEHPCQVGQRMMHIRPQP